MFAAPPSEARSEARSDTSPIHASARSSTLPTAAYIHVPWCHRRCPYCDFYFVVGKASSDFAELVETEARARQSEVGTPLSSVSFGGGTPSTLSTTSVGSIVDRLESWFHFFVDPQITLEANTEDLTDEKLRGLRAAGIERLSIGVQSFDDDVLRSLGRAHDGKRARHVVERAVAIFPRVSVDLIIGVPTEADTRVKDDVECARALGVGHVSTYMLTVEDGTALAKMVASGRRQDVDDGAQTRGYEDARSLLSDGGFRPYEISSFAKVGEESRHNRIYWGKGTYLGLGPGAHSMALLDDGSVVRRANANDLEAWRQDPAGAPHDDERLAPVHAFREALAFGLRDLVDGVDIDVLSKRHHTDIPDDVRRTLDAAQLRGHVVVVGASVRLTSAGVLFADQVARDVLVP